MEGESQIFEIPVSKFSTKPFVCQDNFSQTFSSVNNILKFISTRFFDLPKSHFISWEDVSVSQYLQTQI